MSENSNGNGNGNRPIVDRRDPTSPGAFLNIHFERILMSFAGLLVAGVTYWAGNMLSQTGQDVTGFRVEIAGLKTEVLRLRDQIEMGYGRDDASRDFERRDERLADLSGRLDRSFTQISEVRQQLVGLTSMSEIAKIMQQRNILLDRIVADVSKLEDRADKRDERIGALYDRVFRDPRAGRAPGVDHSAPSE